MFTRNGISYQYTYAYLLVFNPAAPLGQQYRIYPLGVKLPMSMPDAIRMVNEVDPSEVVVANGFVVWDELVPIYRLYGANIIGPPISDLQYNTKENRYEQYFMNMAFFRYVDRPQGEFQLLPYGAWYCEDQCEEALKIVQTRFYPLPPLHRVQLNRQMQAEIQFDNFEESLGPIYTGQLIEPFYTNDEGKFLRIYENVVMVIDPLFWEDVKLLDLPEMVGVQTHPLEDPSSESGQVFVQIHRGKGFNILVEVFEFLDQRGGLKVSGNPITRIYETDNHNLGQCFENICVEYRPSASPGARIRLLPLGREYYRRLTRAPVDNPIQTAIPRSINVKVWERFPLLPPGRTQEVGVAVFDGSKPLKDVHFVLTIQLPDGSQRVHFLPATENNGQTQVTLDPIDEPKGTMIPYQVCVQAIGDELVCLKESFLIWGEE
jgi:hypothetical protein